MDPRRPKVRLNLVRPSEENQKFLTQARGYYRRLIRNARAHAPPPINQMPLHGAPLNTGREAFGFFPTHAEPILAQRMPITAAPQGPVGPPQGPQRRPAGPPQGPQRRLSPIAEVNSNNNEEFNVPLGNNPLLVLRGQLEVLKKNREQIEAQIDDIESHIRENKRDPKRRRTQTSMDRVNGKTYAELQTALNDLQEELELVEQEIEQLEMQLGEEEFVERTRAAAATRKGGRRKARKTARKARKTARLK